MRPRWPVEKALLTILAELYRTTWVFFFLLRCLRLLSHDVLDNTCIRDAAAPPILLLTG